MKHEIKDHAVEFQAMSITLTARTSAEVWAIRHMLANTATTGKSDEFFSVFEEWEEKMWGRSNKGDNTLRPDNAKLPTSHPWSGQ